MSSKFIYLVNTNTQIDNNLIVYICKTQRKYLYQSEQINLQTDLTTRNHSIRMNAVLLPTVRASVAANRCQCQWGIGTERGPQVNKFEQVFNDNHQMSLPVGPEGGSHV